MYIYIKGNGIAVEVQKVPFSCYFIGDSSKFAFAIDNRTMEEYERQFLV